MFFIVSSVFTNEYAHAGHEQSRDSMGVDGGTDVPVKPKPACTVASRGVGVGGRPSPESSLKHVPLPPKDDVTLENTGVDDGSRVVNDRDVRGMTLVTRWRNLSKPPKTSTLVTRRRCKAARQ